VLRTGRENELHLLRTNSHYFGRCFKPVFLGAFAKFRASTVSSILFVCLSVLPFAWNNLAPTGRILLKFDTWGFFRMFLENMYVWLKSDKNNGYCTWRRIYIYDNISVNVWDQSCRKNRFTSFMSSIFFFSENLAVNETMWTCMKQPEATDDNIIGCRKYAIFTPDNWNKSTDTHSEYVVLIASSDIVKSDKLRCCLLLRSYPNFTSCFSAHWALYTWRPTFVLLLPAT
jgi:hypothetical protein